MFSLLQKARSLQLPVDLQLQLFHSLVTPILLYGSEVWGYEDVEIVEKLYNKFCRILLHANSGTPLAMLYGELGTKPLLLDIKQRMINFWCKLISRKQDKLSCIMYGYGLGAQVEVDHGKVPCYVLCLYSLQSHTYGCTLDMLLTVYCK